MILKMEGLFAGMETSCSCIYGHLISSESERRKRLLHKPLFSRRTPSSQSIQTRESVWTERCLTDPPKITHHHDVRTCQKKLPKTLKCHLKYHQTPKWMLCAEITSLGVFFIPLKSRFPQTLLPSFLQFSSVFPSLSLQLWDAPHQAAAARCRHSCIMPQHDAAAAAWCRCCSVMPQRDAATWCCRMMPLHDAAAAASHAAARSFLDCFSF